MELLLIALVLAVIVVFVTVPLRRAADRGGNGGGADDSRLAELEARKEAKYREIRDAELDREAGKVTPQEWGRQDAQLRREAIAILKQIDDLEPAERDR